MQALGLLFAGLASTVLGVTVGALMWSIGHTTRSVLATSLQQTASPDALLGRATAASWSIIAGASMIGAVLITRLAARSGAAQAFTIAGLNMS